MNISSQLKFETLFCSSQQAGFEAKNLEQSYHNTAGWKSQKCALFPIEIILKFEDPIVSLGEMQFLVDPNLKPYRIDIHSFALGQHRNETHPEIDIIDNDEAIYIDEL